MTGSPSAPELFRPQEVRRRAHEILDLLQKRASPSIEVHGGNMKTALLRVLEATKENYPDFQIPPYGLWREFEAGGIDRWAALAGARQFESAEEMLASAADLAVLGALMKTCRPANWVFEDTMTGGTAAGSGASALAAFQMFASGAFSAAMADPYRVDAETLTSFDPVELASGLQWDRQADKTLLDAMLRHLKRCGEAMALRPDLFSHGNATRPGLLAVRLAGESDGAVDALRLLDNLLEAFAPVWDGGAVSGDVMLGDSFAHSGLPGLPDLEEGFICPFHMAAQEMVYSLVEPFAWAGFEVAGLEHLTAPGDTAHAALFVGTGVLELSADGENLSQGSARDRMVELRAASIALTDLLAGLLRQELDVSEGQLPLTCILEGGTSRAGNRIFEERPEKLKNLGKYLDPGAVFWLPFGQ